MYVSLGAPQETYKLYILDEGNLKVFVCSNGCIKWTKNGEIVKKSARTTVERISEICLLKLSGILISEAGNYTCHRQTSDGIHKEIHEILVISKSLFRHV